MNFWKDFWVFHVRACLGSKTCTCISSSVQVIHLWRKNLRNRQLRTFVLRERYFSDEVTFDQVSKICQTHANLCFRERTMYPHAQLLRHIDWWSQSWWNISHGVGLWSNFQISTIETWKHMGLCGFTRTFRIWSQKIRISLLSPWVCSPENMLTQYEQKPYETTKNIKNQLFPRRMYFVRTFILLFIET